MVLSNWAEWCVTHDQLSPLLDSALTSPSLIAMLPASPKSLLQLKLVHQLCITTNPWPHMGIHSCSVLLKNGRPTTAQGQVLMMSWTPT